MDVLQIVKRFLNQVGKIRSLAFSPDGKKIIGASHARTLLIWDAFTSKVSISTHNADIAMAGIDALGGTRQAGLLCCYFAR